MTGLAITLLSAQILLSLLGLIANYTTLLLLLKKFIDRKKLLAVAILAGVAHTASWVSGWYYKIYYTQEKASAASSNLGWMYTFSVDWFEYASVGILMASIVLAVLLWVSPISEKTGELKKNFIIATSFVTILATTVILAGIITMGGIR